MALITIEEFEIATGTIVDEADEPQVTALIEYVSAYITRYTGRSFELVEDAEMRVRADGWGLVEIEDLVEVTSVFQFGTEVSAPNWSWDGMNTIWGLGANQVVDVVVTYGWESVPTDIKGIVIALVASGLGVPFPGSAGTLTRKRSGDVEEEYSSQADGDGDIIITLSSLMSKILENYRRQNWTMRMASPAPPCPPSNGSL